MRNAGLDEAQAGIKIAGRNINNLRYADDTTLMAESEEELKSLLMKVKVKVKSLSRVRLFVTPWTVAHQAPPSMGFSRQEYWIGLPLVITFLPRSKHLLISWLQSPSAVILEPPKIKFLTVSIVSPSICHEAMGPDAMILIF